MNSSTAIRSETTSVTCCIEAMEPWAQSVARTLNVIVNAPSSAPYALIFDEDGVSLQSNNSDKHGRVMVDFCGGSAAHRRLYGGGKGQMIAKAVGLNPKFHPTVLDATAGLGQDAFVLACLGCKVTMMERSPVAFALLTDGLRRAKAYAEANDPELAEILGRLSLREGDSIVYLQGAAGSVADVIYLDPMFPERQKNAAVKKEMQAFHTVIGDDPDAEALLAAALGKAEYRIVVKRPRIAPVIAGAIRNHELQGKSSRFDIYTFKGVPKA